MIIPVSGSLFEILASCVANGCATPSEVNMMLAPVAQHAAAAGSERVNCVMSALRESSLVQAGQASSIALISNRPIFICLFDRLWKSQ